MADISKEEVEKFLREYPFEIEPGQSKISFPLIERIHQRILKGYSFDPIKVHEGTIVDGHHRFISLTILGRECEIIKGGKNTSSQVDCTWEDLSVQSEDYDSDIKREVFEKDYPLKQIE